MYVLFVYKKNALLIPLIIISSLILNMDFSKHNSKYFHTAKVVKVYSSSVVVKEEGKKYYLMGIKDLYVKGDIISYQSKYYDNVQKGGFDIFYRSTKSAGYGYGKNIVLKEESNEPRANLMRRLINDDSMYSKYALTMLYKVNTDANSDLLWNIKKMGITHLFVISGFHISLFFIIVEKGTKKFIKNNKITVSISLASVLFFLYLVYFPITGIRSLATLMIIRSGMMNKIDSLSAVGIIFFVINPWVMFSASMILSFGITSIFYILPLKRNSFTDLLLVSTIAFYMSIPTVSSWSDYFNLLTPLLSIIMTPLISISYIFCLIILPFNTLWFIGSFFFGIVDIIINLLSVLSIRFELKAISFATQIILSSILLVYIYLLRKEKLILFNTFGFLSIIFLII